MIPKDVHSPDLVLVTTNGLNLQQLFVHDLWIRLFQVVHQGFDGRLFLLKRLPCIQTVARQKNRSDRSSLNQQQFTQPKGRPQPTRPQQGHHVSFVGRHRVFAQFGHQVLVIFVFDAFQVLLVL